MNKYALSFVTAFLLVGVIGVGNALAVFQDGGGGDGGGGGGTPPTATLTASAPSVSSGQPVTLTWSSTLASYGCYGDNFSASGASGSTVVNPTVTTTYTLFCNNAYDSAFDSETVTVTIASGFDLTAGLPSVSSGSLYTGNSIVFAGSVTNHNSSNTASTFSNRFQIDLGGEGTYDLNLDAANSIVGINGSQTKTLASPAWTATVGTHKIRLCADSPTSVVSETNEGNNCGSVYTFTVSPPPAPVITIATNPTNITSGQSATLSWSATNATTCTGTNFNTNNAATGSVSVSPTTQTMYGISCTGSGGTTTNSTTLVIGSGTTITTQSNKACSGGTSVGTYTSSSNSCSSYCTGLSASCCTVRNITYQDTGTNSFTCTAYTGTQSTVTANPDGGCQFFGDGEPYNCTSTNWTALLIGYGPAVTASLVTNPTSMSQGQSAVITWSSANASTCTGTNFSTGNATSGTVTVSPSSTTTYTLTCSGPGGTATDQKVLTVSPFTVTCSASPNPATVNASTAWSSTVVGGLAGYSYSWSGTDGLSGTGSSVSKTYTTTGNKLATLTVTSGAQSITTACSGYACQSTNCSCTGIGCGVVVNEGTATDVTATTPSIASGNPVPGQAISFTANIQNIGNNSINSTFGNRFQIDIGADGSYETNLDLASTGGTQFNLNYGQQCTGGTIVYSDYIDLYGSASVSAVIQDMCEANSTSGQCCSAVVTAQSSGGGGGGGGCPACNQVLNIFKTGIANAYKNFALSYDAVTLLVRSGGATLTSTCPSGGYCYGGLWTALSGQHYAIPLAGATSITSPVWSNIPGGTHKVRLCTDNGSQLNEANEGNNCSSDLTFTVSGYDFSAGTPALNSGSLVSSQPVTFAGSVSNNPASYVATGQCQATVVVIPNSACSIGVNSDQVRWITSGATMVTNIDPLTSSPTIPPTGAGGVITANHSEGDFFVSQAIKQDMLANGNVNFSETTFVGRTGHSDQITVDRICKMLTGNMQATASSWGARGWGSCGNNGNLRFNGTIWESLSGCIGAHISGAITCQYPGSPYALSGSYTFPTPLAPGTHTYRLTSNNPTTSTCQATIIVPVQGALCTLTPNPSITIGGGASCTWSPVAPAVYEETCAGATQNFTPRCTGSLTTGTAGDINTSCWKLISPSTQTCSSSIAAQFATIQQYSCLAGSSSTLSWSTSGASSFSIDNGIGVVAPTAAGARAVSPTVTTTYTGTATTDIAIFNFIGSLSNRFELDLGNNGTYDTNLDAPNSLTNLNVNQSKQVVSPSWTASVGTHKIRLCANTPSSVTEGDTSNNCGPEYTFTVVASPTPTAFLSASPTSIIAGNNSTLTWSSTNATSCTGTNFSTGGATGTSSVAVSPASNTTYSVVCTGAGGTSTPATAAVTVTAGTVDVTSGTPSLASGTLVNGNTVTFSASVTNGGSVSTGATFSNRFQIDLSNNGTWDTNLDATNSTVGLTAGQVKAVTSPSWSATVGTHKIRMCADSPTSNVSESNEGNNCGAEYTFTVSAPVPTALLSASPTTIVSGNSSTLTWSSTNATSCTGTNFSTGGAIGTSSVAVSPTATTTYSVVCSGAGGTSTPATAIVNVTPGTIDFTSGTPSVNTGSLASGVVVTFKGNVTNGGTGNTSATFSNRFQIDLGNNSSSWDVTLVATSSITGLNSGQSKQANSPNWTAVTGTHEIRMCADSPTSSVSETNESNNCGPSWIFTVGAAPNAPSISGPTSGYTNASYVFSFAGTDPASTTVRYGVDWDNNSVVDEYLPATGHVASGLWQDKSRTWTTTGSKTFRALTQNSLGANSGWTTKTITISDAPPPPPVALITVTPSTINAGATTTISWSSSNATTCTGTNFSTGNATSGTVVTSALYASVTYTVTCSGTTAPPDSDTATVTVDSAVDLTAGIPGLDSGYLYDGGSVAFWANVTNAGSGNTSATFSNRFQVDLNANGSWDTNLDSINSVDGLNAGLSKQVTSPSWTAVEGTHRVRLCADSPTSDVPESDETNNCSGTVFNFSVTAAPECADGIDNNDNGATDYPSDHACATYDDPTEEFLESGNLTLEAFTTGADIAAPGVVQENSTAQLRWTVEDVLPGTCTLTGDNGDAWVLSGSEGTQISSPIQGHTTFVLQCTDLNDDTVFVRAEVRTAPEYEEI